MRHTKLFPVPLFPALLFSVLSFIMLTGIACQPKTVVSIIPAGQLTGKLVLAGPCGQATLKVLSGSIDSSILTKSWQNPGNDSVYTNVFALTNTCSFISAGLQKGDVISFDLDSDKADTCYVCFAYVPAPPTHHAIKNVQKIGEK